MPKRRQTQKTRPEKGPPATIPVPTREDVESDLAKLAKPERKSATEKPKPRSKPWML